MPPGAGAGAAMSSASVRLTGSAKAEPFHQNHGAKMALVAPICEGLRIPVNSTRKSEKKGARLEKVGEMLGVLLLLQRVDRFPVRPRWTLRQLLGALKKPRRRRVGSRGDGEGRRRP